MIDTIQSDSELDPGLVGSLGVLRDPTRGTHSERMNFARALLGMYPEGADAIIAPLTDTLDRLAQRDAVERQLSSGPGSLDELWGTLLGLPAATPQVETVRERAQQLFLAGVTRTTQQVAASFLGAHGSGQRAVENLQAIARFVQNASDTYTTLSEALERTEAIHITRAVLLGNVALIQATLGLADVNRIMGGETHGSWLRQWAQAARNLGQQEKALDCLDALLGAGVDINATDSEGLTTLEWLLDGQRILAHDSMRMGARIGKTIHLDSAEALNVAFENSAPVAEALLDRGARWEHLDGAKLHPHAAAILASHPAVRRARLGEQAKTGHDRPGPGKRGL